VKSVEREELTRRGFTDSAKRVVHDIAERASARGMFAGEFTEATASMLAVLSILRWERKVALAALEKLGADLDAVARELDAAIVTEGNSSRRAEGPRFYALPSGQQAIDWDQDGPRQPLLNHAEEEAQQMGHDYVGTEHLLLAAINHACPGLGQLFNRHGITYGQIRETVVDLLADRIN
jgi:ATP-dependent Clp protease ATP-binding subunit ClpA